MTQVATSDKMLKELSSNRSSLAHRSSCAASGASAAETVRSACSRRTSDGQSMRLAAFMEEQEASKVLLRLDHQYKMKDGAPRLLFYSTVMKLPCNHTAYHTLALRRVDAKTAAAALSEVKGLFGAQREERCATRLWGCLTIHEPKIAPVAFLPYISVAVCRAIPTNPIAALECAMHLLHNMCAEWLAEYPRPPLSILRRVDDFFCRHSHLQKLWAFLNDDHLEGGCSLLDYLWVPFQTFLLLNVSASDWLQLFDDVVCRPDGTSFFCGLVLATLWQLEDALLACTSRDQVLAVIGTNWAWDERTIRQIIGRANRLAPALLMPEMPLTYLPSTGEYYPIINVGCRPPVPVKVDKRAVLAELEADQATLERRVRVELSTLTMNSDMQRFHGALAAPQGADGIQHPSSEEPLHCAGAEVSSAPSPSQRAAAVPYRQPSLVLEGPTLPPTAATAAGPLQSVVSLSPTRNPAVHDEVPAAVVQAVALMLANDVASRSSVSRERSLPVGSPAKVTAPLQTVQLSRSVSQDRHNLDARGYSIPASMQRSMVTDSVGYASSALLGTSRTPSSMPSCK